MADDEDAANVNPLALDLQIAQDRIGSLLDGGITLEKVLGAGGMAAVYLAKKQTLSGTKDVAVKVLHPSIAGNPDNVKRFLREAQTLMGLSHQNIITLEGDGILSDGAFFFVMPFIKGQTLEGLIEDHSRRKAVLPWRRWVLMGIQVADALRCAHESNVVHRDVKPANIMLRPGATQDHAVVMDFGLVQMRISPDGREHTQLTGMSVPFGTPDYIPPEQARDARSADSRADIYSLGATFYECATGRTVFMGASSVEIMAKHMFEPPVDVMAFVTDPSFPPALGKLIMWMLAKDPNDRPQTMREVIEALAAIQGVETMPVVPIVPVDGAMRPGDASVAPSVRATTEPVPGTRRRRRIAVAAIAVVALFTGVVVSAMHQSPSPIQRTARPVVARPIPPPVSRPSIPMPTPVVAPPVVPEPVAVPVVAPIPVTTPVVTPVPPTVRSGRTPRRVRVSAPECVLDENGLPGTGCVIHAAPRHRRRH